MSNNRNYEQKNLNNQSKSAGQRQKYAIMALAALVVILVAVNSWTFFYYIPKSVNSLFIEMGNKYSFLNPARNFVKQEDLIINIQPLRDDLNEKYEADPNISVYFEYLSTGANIAINKDAEFWPASLLKLPVAMAVSKKIEKGEWKWSNELVLMNSDKNEKFGDLYKKPVGTRFKIEDLIKKTLTESDNTANFILVRNLEPEEFQDIYDHLGLSEFISSEGKISAKKYSVMFRALYNASYLSEENSQKLLSLMRESKFDEYVKSGLPEDILYAHKIGIVDDKNVFLDAGIVYIPKRSYILTVMVNTPDINFAQKTMKDISEKAYTYIFNYKD